MSRAIRLVFVLAAALSFLPHASAQDERQDEGRTVEVIEVQGIIDGSVERWAIAGLEEAQQRAALVVLQIDSKGVVGAGRLERLERAIERSDVPVAAWIGPPGAEAANGAALLLQAADVKAMSPGSRIGPIETRDLKDPGARPSGPSLFEGVISAARAQDDEIVDIVEPALEQVVAEIEDPKIDLDDVRIRFHKLDMIGRVLHAAAQPSIAYLFLLAGLFAITFELFHPSTGPAGVTGAIALAFSGYGIYTLGGNWYGVALIVLSMVAFSIDLRFESLGPFTFGAIAVLIAGSLVLFTSPWLRVSPWILGLGIIGMTIFMVSVMTRVLRDLRLVARGELEVRDAHAHLEDDHDS